MIHFTDRYICDTRPQYVTLMRIWTLCVSANTCTRASTIHHLVTGCDTQISGNIAATWIVCLRVISKLNINLGVSRRANLAATKQFYERCCPSVCPPVTPFSLGSCHRIIMKFSIVITINTSDVYAKGQGQRLKVKITEVKTNLTPIWAFPDCD